MLKLKYRDLIHEIVRRIILEKVAGSQVTSRLKMLIEAQNVPLTDTRELFQAIEIEIASLHERNIARFKILPNEFKDWKDLQSSK